MSRIPSSPSFTPPVPSGAMDAEARQAEFDQVKGAQDLNRAKRDTYQKATIQARN